VSAGKYSAFPDGHGSREKVDQHRVGVRFRKGGGITPNPERPAAQPKRGRLELLLNKDEVRLRRCGASHNEPFCDGSLKKVGFMSNLDEKPQEGRTP
jgi:CDGSH-type Zn-finger protein